MTRTKNQVEVIRKPEVLFSELAYYNNNLGEQYDIQLFENKFDH